MFDNELMIEGITVLNLIIHHDNFIITQKDQRVIDITFWYWNIDFLLMLQGENNICIYDFLSVILAKKMIYMYRNVIDRPLSLNQKNDLSNTSLFTLWQIITDFSTNVNLH